MRNFLRGCRHSLLYCLRRSNTSICNTCLLVFFLAAAIAFCAQGLRAAQSLQTTCVNTIGYIIVCFFEFIYIFDFPCKCW
jgi:hypothetical protein